MSCPRVIIAALVGVGLLTGCGFRPLYFEPAADSGVLTEFAAITIKPIADRLGQDVRNHLLDMLNPRGRPARARYGLEVRLRERIQELAVERTALATRANLFVGAEFWLRDVDTGRTLTAGSTEVVSSYNLLDSEFATLSAENDARERSARLIAEDIRIRLGVYFAEGKTAAAPSQ